MKKVLATAVLAIVVITALWAQTPSFMFSVGTTISHSEYRTSESRFAQIGIGSDDNSGGVAVGGEVRISFRNLKFGAIGESTVINPKMLFFSGLLDFGVIVDIKDVVGIMFAMGPSVTYIFNDSSAPKTVDDEGNQTEEGFFSALIHGPFNYRVNLEAIVGPVLRVGVAYTFPTSFTLNAFNLVELNPFKKGNIDSGRFSFCLQMRIF